jgi:hypothetical protein
VNASQVSAAPARHSVEGILGVLLAKFSYPVKRITPTPFLIAVIFTAMILTGLKTSDDKVAIESLNCQLKHCLASNLPRTCDRPPERHQSRNPE